MNSLSLFGLIRSSATSALRRNAFTSAAAAAVNLPENLVLAPEKPKKAVHHKVVLEFATKNDAGNFELPVYSMNTGKSVGTAELDESVFGENIRRDILQRVVRWQLAKLQSGNHKTKTRSEVSGSGKKAWKQKGTGRARVGNIRPPQWRGGYRVHGPVVRDHSFDLPKKVRAMGLRVALSAKLHEGKIAIVDSLEMDSNKTKDATKVLSDLGWKNVLFIQGSEDVDNFRLAIRNIPHMNVLPERGANVYSILKQDLLVLSKDAVEALTERLHVD